MLTTQPSSPPFPLVLLTREGKGCRQYTFDTLDELKAWTERKPYRDERLLVMPMHAKRFLAREWMPANEAHAFSSKLLNEAKEIEETAAALARQVLKQAEAENPNCAFWFLSALSKLRSTRPDMRVDDVFQFASAAMPGAAKQWTGYVKKNIQQPGENKMPHPETYRIDGAIADNKYAGAGLALAAITGGQLVGLVYLRDIIDEIDEEDSAAIKEAINDDRLAPTVRQLQALGEVSVGMCSCYEFVVL